MLIPLANIIQINYPTAILGLKGNVQLADHGDGLGPVIQQWDVPNIVQPTSKQLIDFQTDLNTIAAYQAQLNIITNAPILAQLQTIDMQSITPLREGGPTNIALLSSLTTQAIALRAQLLPITAAGVISMQQSNGVGS